MNINSNQSELVARPCTDCTAEKRAQLVKSAGKTFFKSGKTFERQFMT